MGRASKRVLALGFLVASGIAAWSQTSPEWYQGLVPTPAQWNAEFASKQDTINFGTDVLAALEIPLGSPGSVLVEPLSGALSVTTGGTGASTFTVNLPLLGNGTNPLIQGTLSGTTTEFATVTGALTNGDCVSIGAGGNLIDATAPCSSGGGGSGTVTSATTGQIGVYPGTGTTIAGTTTGTGVVTALGVNTGSAGAFVVNGGALGTPSSGTLTNAVGLPKSSLTGLGTGVGTALGVSTGAAGGFAAISGTLTPGDCVVIGSGPTLADAGGPCGFGADDIRYYGAVADGVTDNTSSINTAIVNAPNCAIVPASTLGFYVAGTIINGRCFRGENFKTPLTNAFAGSSWIKCGLATTVNGVCVKTSTTAFTAPSPTMERLAIVGSDTPAAGSIGFQVNAGYNTTTRDVVIYGFDTCGKWGPVGNSTVWPLASYNYNLNLTNCKTNHAIIDGMPEVRFVGGRWSNSRAAVRDFVYFTLTGTQQAAGGPNTEMFTDVQFNASDMGCGFYWGGYTGSGGVQNEFKFLDTHAEWHSYTGVGKTGLFCSDSTVPTIERLYVKGMDSSLPGSNAPLFNLDAATRPSNFFFEGNWLGSTDWTLAFPTGGSASDMNRFTDNRFFGNVTLTGDASEYVASKGNTYPSLTFSGAWGQFTSSGDAIVGSLVDTATGNIAFSTPLKQAWTPVLHFSGSNTGLTQTANGTVQRTSDGGWEANFNINVTALGSASGAVSITGLPSTYKCTQSIQGYGSLPNNIANVSGLTGAVSYQLGTGTPATVFIVQNTATGTAQLTQANFSSSTVLNGTVRCGLTG